ncbi:hypothetical protein LV75_006723 [Actinokineospora diospyrosa]|uniref:Universal stress protein family protein n=1 Tax=Actinokineospora diospyrosa TaxID=103728 RepID=A0ABT1INS7_9PSEU|nr:hypothetical protein [Actinokineospora diospyrosa]
MTVGRDILAVVVAVDSPLGRVARAVDVLSSHVPAVAQPLVCSFCVGSGWPCRSFLDAAQHVNDRGVDVGMVVPVDLHPVLWPQKKPAARVS